MSNIALNTEDASNVPKCSKNVSFTTPFTFPFFPLLANVYRGF